MIKGPLVPIFLVILVDLLGLSVILPLLPFYAESFGASPAVVGVLLSIFAVCQLLAGPPLGQWSDRIGRKPVLLVSQVGTLIGFVMLGFANTLWLVFLARILDGATAGNMTVAQAYVSDVTSPENRAQAFGIVGIAYGIGFLLGPALSGYLVQFGPAYPIAAAAGLAALSILATWFLLPAVRPAMLPPGERAWSWRAYARPLADPHAGPRFWQFFASQLAISVLFSGFALFAERRLTIGGAPFGSREVGYTFAYLGLVGILFLGALGPMVKRLSEHAVVQIGFALTGLSFVALAFAGRMPSVLLTMTFFAVGTAVLRPSLTSLITQRTARTEQGMVLGLMQSLQSVAQIVAPLAAGVLIQRQLLSEWAWLGAAIGAAGLVLAARLAREQTQVA
jgi:MFS transporter, DHA1 family, tetracycline resistance protein